MLGACVGVECDAVDEQAMEARTSICVDVVRLRGRKLTGADESDSDWQQYIGGYIYDRCDGQVGIDDAKPESDACREVGARPPSRTVLLANRTFTRTHRNQNRDRTALARGAT